MIGSLKPALNQLNIQNLKFYDAVYCGVCNSLRTDYGFAYGLLHNFDTLFLSIFLLSQDDHSIEFEPIRCPLSVYTVKRNAIANSSALKISSAISIKIFHEKIIDDIRDTRLNYFPKIAGAIIKSGIQHANSILDEYGIPTGGFEIARGFQIDVENRKRGNQNLNFYFEPTSYLMSNILCGTSEKFGKPLQASSLEDIGKYVGRMVTLVDACEDLAFDRIKMLSNPLIDAFDIPRGKFIPIDVFISVNRYIFEQMVLINDLLHPLNFNPNKEIVANILTYGLLARLKIALRKMWEDNHWTGKFHINNNSVYSKVGCHCKICRYPHVIDKHLFKEKKHGDCSKDFWGFMFSLSKQQDNYGEFGFENSGDFVLNSSLNYLYI